MNKIDHKEVLDIAEEAAWLTVCLCEESGNEALKTTNAYAENKKALRYIREHQRIESEEPNMDAIKTREINVLVKENRALRQHLEAITSEWMEQAGRVFESMGETNPRAYAIDQAVQSAIAFMQNPPSEACNPHDA